jgi:trans-2-enoyl-CoA reductase
MIAPAESIVYTYTAKKNIIYNRIYYIYPALVLVMLRVCMRGGAAAQSVWARGMSYAVRYTETGEPLKVLKYAADADDKTVGAKDVHIKMLAAPINPADLNMVEGVYGTKSALPAVGGSEGVGIITEIGNDVKGLKVDDWVIPGSGSGGFGTWRSYVKTSADNVMKVANDIPAAYAATLSVNPATAYRLLADFEKLSPGDVIIQNGANSMVGMAVIQMARERGIKTINVIRQDRPEADKIIRLLDNLGGDINIQAGWLNSHQCKEMLKELPPIKLGFNCAGGDIVTDMCRVMGTGGTIVSYGGMSKRPIVVPEDVLAYKNLTLRGFWMTEWYRTHSADEKREMIDEIIELIRADKLQFNMVLHDFDDFGHALKIATEPFNFRKIVLNMNFPDRMVEHDARDESDYEIFQSPAV